MQTEKAAQQPAPGRALNRLAAGREVERRAKELEDHTICWSSCTNKPRPSSKTPRWPIDLSRSRISLPFLSERLLRPQRSVHLRIHPPSSRSQEGSLRARVSFPSQ